MSGGQTGKFFHHATEVLGSRQLQQLFVRGKVTPDYFFEDYEAECHLIRSEQIANDVNRRFLSQPTSEKLRTVLEENLDHGFNHIRRVEKWFKAIVANDVGLRRNPAFLYFALSVYMAIRNHDLIEVYTGQKQNHDAAAALLSLGIIGREHDAFISFEDREKFRWATAFICLHHSKPENMPSADALVRNGLFDPRVILSQARFMVQQAGKSDLVNFFPPFALAEDVVQAIEHGQLKQPVSTKNVIEGLRLATMIMAMADKLDGLYPEDLSATRTVLTRPGRSFDTQLYTGMSFEEEFAERIASGGTQESRCDLDRLLFEITRATTFDGVSPWASYVYAHGMKQKAGYLGRVIPAFMEGNFYPYLAVYQALEKNMIRTVLMKCGCTVDQIHTIATLDDAQMRQRAAETTLRQLGIDGRNLDQLLYTIRYERDVVASALQRKYTGLIDLGLTEERKKHIYRLLRYGIERQQQNLFQYPGFGIVTLPYNGYYAVNITQWML